MTLIIIRNQSVCLHLNMKVENCLIANFYRADAILNHTLLSLLQLLLIVKF